MIGDPKPERKKKRQRHGDSIMQKKKECYICAAYDLHNLRRYTGLHRHHIYAGVNRKTSEAEGFTCWLCQEHHTVGRSAVHNNIDMMRYLQMKCQEEYEKTHSREEFMQLLHRNYL